ncbi:hypothetical protein FWD07_01320 [Candidatus Saccharibacteria bacterium]|nr:hypothetical protein [Candidatus Saccharibacteria bacterium]
MNIILFTISKGPGSLYYTLLYHPEKHSPNIELILSTIHSTIPEATLATPPKVTSGDVFDCKFTDIAMIFLNPHATHATSLKINEALKQLSKDAHLPDFHLDKSFWTAPPQYSAADLPAKDRAIHYYHHLLTPPSPPPRRPLTRQSSDDNYGRGTHYRFQDN